MSAELLIPKKLIKKINSNTIWITGTGRSGTTIIGNLLASLKGTEYFYEPDTFEVILFLKNKIKKKYSKLIFDTYFYIDLIKNGLNKRRINLNTLDDSYYFNYKQKKDLVHKSNFDIFKNVKQILPKIIIKLTGFLDEIYYINKYYNFKIIYVDRDSLEIINSMYKKKWFTKNLNRGYIPAIKYKKKYFPLWLSKKQFKSWQKLNEYEKIALYIIRTKDSLKKKKNIKVVSYNDLVRNPKNFLKELIKITGLKPTFKTYNLIKSIKKPSKRN